MPWFSLTHCKQLWGSSAVPRESISTSGIRIGEKIFIKCSLKNVFAIRAKTLYLQNVSFSGAKRKRLVVVDWWPCILKGFRSTKPAGSFSSGAPHSSAAEVNRWKSLKLKFAHGSSNISEVHGHAIRVHIPFLKLASLGTSPYRCTAEGHWKLIYLLFRLQINWTLDQTSSIFLVCLLIDPFFVCLI